MNQPLKYKFGDELLTEVEIIQRAYDRAKEYPPDTRKAYVETIRNLFIAHNMKDKFQTIFLPLFGVIFLLIILGIAFFTPYPSKFQSGTFWVVLSLAAAACGALIPGFIEVEYKGFLRAGGALAIFCFMYFSSPSIIDKTDSTTLEKITIYVVEEDGSSVQPLSSKFDKNSHGPLTESVSTIINDYLGANYQPSHYVYYRKTDGKIYISEACYELTDQSVLVIPDKVVKHYPNKRQAYIKCLALITKSNN